jgi:hypothetical protein
LVAGASVAEQADRHSQPEFFWVLMAVAFNVGAAIR